MVGWRNVSRLVGETPSLSPTLLAMLVANRAKSSALAGSWSPGGRRGKRGQGERGKGEACGRRNGCRSTRSASSTPLRQGRRFWLARRDPIAGCQCLLPRTRSFLSTAPILPTSCRTYVSLSHDTELEGVLPIGMRKMEGIQGSVDSSPTIGQAHRV